MASTLGDLINIVRDRLLETLALTTPVSPIVGPQGTAGFTAYAYRIVALNDHGHSIASDHGETPFGPPALDATNFIRMTWAPVTRATGYQVVRIVGGGTGGVIATLGDVQTYDDHGAAGDGQTAPTTNTSGTLGIFWSDDELLGILLLGAKDLWRAFIDLHQEHFFTVNTTDVTHPIDAESLEGVPANVHRVLLIAPRDTTPSSTMRFVRYLPRDYNSPEFLTGLAQESVEATQPITVYYAVTGAGAPVAAPTIYVSRRLTATLPLRVVYIPTLAGTFTAASDNPVPGETDAALVAFTVAFALAKERPDRSPDPNWLAIYQTEKKSCLVAAAPRQEQEPSVTKGVLDDCTGPGLTGDDLEYY